MQAADGSQYNQTALLTNGRFDPVKYEQLGPAYFSATNALYLITSNLSLGAVLTHVLLWHWDDLKPLFRSFNPWNKVPVVINDPVRAFCADVALVLLSLHRINSTSRR